MYLSELLGSRVIRESGEELGRLLDLRLDEQHKRISGIVIDDSSFTTRLVRGRGPNGRTLPLEAVPWESVVHMEPGHIVVRGDSSTGRQGKET